MTTYFYFRGSISFPLRVMSMEILFKKTKNIQAAFWWNLFWFYGLPAEHRRQTRTTNSILPTFGTVKRRCYVQPWFSLSFLERPVPVGIFAGGVRGQSFPGQRGVCKREGWLNRLACRTMVVYSSGADFKKDSVFAKYLTPDTWPS